MASVNISWPSQCHGLDEGLHVPQWQTMVFAMISLIVSLRIMLADNNERGQHSVGWGAHSSRVLALQQMSWPQGSLGSSLAETLFIDAVREVGQLPAPRAVDGTGIL